MSQCEEYDLSLFLPSSTVNEARVHVYILCTVYILNLVYFGARPVQMRAMRHALTTIEGGKTSDSTQNVLVKHNHMVTTAVTQSLSPHATTVLAA